MGYQDMVAIAQSVSLRDRLRMCAVQEIAPTINPEWWVAMHIDRLATQPGWGEAFASAAANKIADPGADEGVITDGMILSAVQALVGQDAAAAQAAAKAAADAEAAEQTAKAAADEDRRQQQRDDELWRMQEQARIAAEYSPPSDGEGSDPPPDQTTPTGKKATK